MSRRRARRHVRVPPDLTSLFDVLFILIFVALIRAAALQQQAEAARPAPTPPPPPAQPQPAPVLQAKALAQLDAELAARPVVVARISPDGKLTAFELAGKRVAVDVPLLEESRDPDIALAYLGDRSADQRVCKQVALHLALPDLAAYLVIFAPDARSADLAHALYEGLRRDVDRCQVDQRGLAVVVDPEAEVTP